MRALVVTTAFGEYEAGQMIKDRAEMKAARDQYPNYVVEINAPAEPDADKKSASSAADSKKSTSADLPAVKSPSAA